MKISRKKFKTHLQFYMKISKKNVLYFLRGNLLYGVDWGAVECECKVGWVGVTTPKPASDFLPHVASEKKGKLSEVK